MREHEHAGAGHSPYFLLLTVIVAAFGIYLATMPKTIALEDDGLFVMSSYFNGVSHPPGYPLHSVLGHLFSQIPLGSVAARVHALSAFFAALSAGVIWLITWQLQHNRLAATVAALACALSATFWSQAIIAEVYSLNTFLFFLVLLLCQKAVASDARGNDQSARRFVLAAAFVYGLALSNHWPLAVLSTPGLIVLAWPVMVKRASVLFRAVPFFLLGLVPYAWLLWNASTDPVISFTGPIQSIGEFIAFVARERYAAVDAGAGVGIADNMAFQAFFAGSLVEEFGIGGVILIVAGLYSQFVSGQGRTAAALLLAFLGNSVLLVLLLGFEYNDLYRSVIRVYFLPSYAIAAIWLASGFIFAVNKVCGCISVCRYQSVFGSLIAVVLLVAIAAPGYRQNDRHEYSWGEQYARQVLDAVPPNAKLILNDDISVATVGYMHLVNGYRPDVTLYTDKGLVFRNRLFDPRGLQPHQLQTAFSEYVAAQSETLYSTSADFALFPHQRWLVNASNRTLKGQILIDTEGLDAVYLKQILHSSDTVDAWTRRHRHQLLVAAVPYVIEKTLGGQNTELLQQALTEAASSLDGLTALLTYLELKGLREKLGGSYAQRAEMLLQFEPDRETRARYINLKAYVERMAGKRDAAADRYLESISNWPDIDNLAFAALGDLYIAMGKQRQYRSLLVSHGEEFLARYGD